jgi:hypothetical protein
MLVGAKTEIKNMLIINLRKLSSVLLFTSIFLCGSITAKAQHYFYDQDYYDSDLLFEAGISVNAMNSLTDLAGKKGIGKRFLKDLNLGQTHASFGVFGSAIYKNAIAIRIEGTFGKVSSRDELLKGVTDIAFQRYNRNLDFRSRIYDAFAVAEIHPLYMFINWARRDVSPPRFSPYIAGGVGIFSFNPQGTIPGTNTWVNLQPLSTEGQGFPNRPDRPNYKLKELIFPVGGGIKYEASRLLNFRLEVLHRFTRTDYLDDLSTTYVNPADFALYLPPSRAALAVRMADKQINPVAVPSTGRKRGTATENDGYLTIALKMSLIIGRGKAVF